FLQFALRNVLLLRGVAVVTIYDTLGAAAKLGATVLGIIGKGITDMLDALFAAVGALLKAVTGTIQFFGPRLQTVANQIMEFLRYNVANTLIFIGNTRVFRLLYALVDALPRLLPALIELLNGAQISKDAQTKLDAIKPLDLSPAPYLTPPSGIA